jgi:hypothetical protein
MGPSNDLARIRRLLPLPKPKPPAEPRIPKKRGRKPGSKFPGLYFRDPKKRGAKGGRYAKNKRFKGRVTLRAVLREILSRSPELPPWSEIYREVRARCRWSRFRYETWQTTYLPDWRKGKL